MNAKKSLRVFALTGFIHSLAGGARMNGDLLGCHSRPRSNSLGGIRRMFLAVLVLLGFAGSALAQGEIVRWDAVVGTQGEVNPLAQMVGEFEVSPYLFWVEGGKVMLNLNTGEIKIQIKHVSWASNPGATPIGGPLGGYPIERRGRIVCDARGQHGDPQTVSTEPFSFDDTGSVDYKGVVDLLPDVCSDYPNQIAFLVTGAETYRYFAYGAARIVLAHH